jgi:hypothetical protein
MQDAGSGPPRTRALGSWVSRRRLVCCGRMGDNMLAMNEEISFRHSEPVDYEAIHLVYSGTRTMADTLANGNVAPVDDEVGTLEIAS